MIEEATQKKQYFKNSPKFTLYLFGLGGLLAFITISAWWDLTFSEFNVKDYIANTLILIAISLATMVLTDMLSAETNKNKIVGVYNIASNDYENIRNQIAGIRVYFSQWYFWYLDIETKKKREGHLLLHGFDGIAARKIVSYAEIIDIDLMKGNALTVKTLPNGKKVVLPRIETEEQETAVKEVLSGLHDVKKANPNEYLFVEDVAEVNMRDLERQDYLRHRKAQSKRRMYILRVIIVVLFSLLLVALMPAGEEGDNARKWWLYAQRIGAFVSSFISGWMVGSTDTNAESALIKDKASILAVFKDCYVKKLWQPKTQEELDEETIEEYEKQQANLAETPAMSI